MYSVRSSKYKKTAIFSEIFDVCNDLDNKVFNKRQSFLSFKFYKYFCSFHRKKQLSERFEILWILLILNFARSEQDLFFCLFVCFVLDSGFFFAVCVDNKNAFCFILSTFLLFFQAFLFSEYIVLIDWSLEIQIKSASAYWLAIRK